MADAALERVLAGRFRIDALLGEGGMGSVYRATDLSIGRQVAIKLLRREVAEDRSSLQRMREEAVALASLRHPNVVQLYDFHAGSPDTTFLLMELVPGESLASRLDRGPVPVATAVDYARQVLSALAAAHAAGIIHRDIKPANVLVMPVAGQRDLVKVLDFGIAKLTEETIRRRPTTAGVLIGTPNSMSPEQAHGRPVDARSDLYACGLLLYTLLGGANPFKGIDLADTLRRVQDMVPPPLVEVRGDVPRALSDVVVRAMAKDPAQRFQTAIEMLHALEAASATHAAAAADTPAMTGSTQTVRDPTAITVPQVRSHASSRAPAPNVATPSPSRPSSSVGWFVAIAVLGMMLVGTVGVLAFVLGGRTTGAAPAAADASASTTVVIDAGPVAARATTDLPTPAPSPSTSSSSKRGQTTPSKKADALDPRGSNGACSCFPLPELAMAADHGGNVALGSSVAPLRCDCALEGSRLCPTPLVKCAAGSPGCTAGEFAPCPSTKIVSAKEALPCSGFNFLGEKVQGKVQWCEFPESVTSYPGPQGKSCEGLSVHLKPVRGVTRCRL